MSVDPVLALSRKDMLEVRFPDGRVEATGHYPHEHYPGDPPMVESVEKLYFEEASLFAAGDTLWIRIDGGY